MCFPDCDHSRKMLKPVSELPVHICFLPGDETLCGLVGAGGTQPIYIHEQTVISVPDDVEIENALADTTCQNCKRELQVLTC